MADEVTNILLGLKQDMGKVLQGQDNLSDHVKSVSDKANKIREELNEHKENSEAHGIGIAIKTAKIIGAAAGGLLAVFETFMHMGKH